MSAGPIHPLCRARLEQGAEALGIELASQVSEQILRFLALLVKWNKAYNLTAVRDPVQMVERHLIDSLSILPYLQGEHILDIGTGPGLPGIPLALLRPDGQFVLLDSNSKKIRFVRQVVLELGLKNVQPVHARVESFDPERAFSTLISRAFTSLPNMLRLTKHLLGNDTVLLAMKGAEPIGEINRLAGEYTLKTLALRVPFSAGERHLVLIRHELNNAAKL